MVAHSIIGKRESLRHVHVLDNWGVGRASIRVADRQTDQDRVGFQESGALAGLYDRLNFGKGR
jgi:hypothetical protein